MMKQHIDPDAYDVYDYRTGDLLDGSPTLELCEESLSAGDTGAVCATYDYDASLWHYVSEDERSARESRGDRVRTIYVRES